MPFRSVVTAAGGAGSMAATAADAARWMQAFAGGDVLTPDDAARRCWPTSRARRPSSRGSRTASGSRRSRSRGATRSGTRAGSSGFRNVVRYLPGEGVTIAVLTNQGVKDPARIAEALLKIVLPPLAGVAAPSRPSATPVGRALTGRVPAGAAAPVSRAGRSAGPGRGAGARRAAGPPRPPDDAPPAPRGARSGCASWSRRGVKPSATSHGIAIWSRRWTPRRRSASSIVTRLIASPVAPGATRPADPVDVVLGVPRQLEVHHVGQVVDVQAAGRDVGRDEDRGSRRP